MGGVAIKMNCNDCFCARSNRIFYTQRIDIESVLIRFNWYWSGSCIGYSQPCGNVGVGWDNNFITYTNVIGTQDKMKCFQSITHTNAVIRFTVNCKFIFE